MLDTHEPERPLRSLRDFGRHILGVMFGLILALGVEKTVEWRHHVRLEREADANILSELRDNLAELDETLDAIPAERRQLLDLRRKISALRIDEGEQHLSAALGFQMGSPREVSWQTANTTGALALMDYAHVKRYASVYTDQGLVIHHQEEAMRGVIQLLAALGVVADEGDSDELMFRFRNEGELAAVRSAIRDVLAQLLVLEQNGATLRKHYKEVLDGKPTDKGKAVATR